MSKMGDIGRQLLAIALGSACIFSASCATAQITPDRTLPNNSRVTINGNVFNITGGTQAGRNLFHSFQQFSVPTGGTASFINSADINNIISRVTGGSASNIDGLIKTSGTANLFFLNPSGIVFGQHASLNVGGSFVATTANAIQFGNQGTFSASVPDNPALLTINPSALLYNQIAAGASIQNSSSSLQAGLQVPDGKSLLLVGGDINMDGGGLTAYGGRVELSGLAAPGTVGLNVAGNTLSLSVPSGIQRSDVSLSNQAFIHVFGDGGGDIAVNARNFNVLSNSGLFAGIASGLGNGSSTKAGDININADAISVDGGDIDNVVYSSSTSKGKVGNGGNINITAGSLSLTDGSLIILSTAGQGNAGNISINARDAITLDGNGNNRGFPTRIDSSTRGTQKGGDIKLTTGFLSVSNGAQLSASALGVGNAGNINITTKDVISLDAGSSVSNTSGAGTAARVSFRLDENNSPIITIQPPEQTVFPNARGNSGNINITTNRLAVTNGARLTTSTNGQGNAGNINVNTNTATFSGSTPNGSPGGASSAVETSAVGKGGIININTDELTVDNGAQLVASTFGRGDAGSINIIARDIVSFNGVGSNGSPSGASSAVDAKAVGNGGNLTVDAKRLNILNGAAGDVSNLGSGNLNAGNLQVRADLINLDFGKLIANSTSGQGGNINLQASNILLLQHNSLISNTSGTSLVSGFEGNFTLNTKFLVAAPLENSDIITNAFSGRGGNINITASEGVFGFVVRTQQDLERLLGTSDPNPQKLPTNDIAAFSQTNPIIITPDIDPSRGLVILPKVMEQAPKLVSSSCNAFNETASGSQFTITGRGGLPPSPDEPLTSDVVWTDTRLPVTTAQHQHKTHAAKPKPQPIAIIPATGWVFNDKGEVTLISSVTNATTLNTPTSCPVR